MRGVSAGRGAGFSLQRDFSPAFSTTSTLGFWKVGWSMMDSLMRAGVQVEGRTLPDRRGACVLSALVCVCIGLAWQVLTVHYNYGGNWTALFVTGSHFPVPRALASEHLYVLPNSVGYDGQMYHYVAHDPLMQRGFRDFIDNARLRYRRILLPALAFILAAGRQPAIDTSYIVSNLLFLFSGAWWLSRYLVLSEQSPALSILFVLVPAALISLDRLTVDLPLTALCIGAAYYAKIESRWRLYAVLVLAGLSRETGLVLTMAFCISRCAQHRFVQAALFSTAALPACLWYLFVDSRTSGLGVHWSNVTPLLGIVGTLIHPVQYPFSPAVNAIIVTEDYLTMAGIMVAAILAFSILRRNPFGYIEIAASLWAVGALFLPYAFWQDCCSGGRLFTPFLIFLVLSGMPRLAIARALPLILVSMRTWLQLVSPLFGIVRGFLDHWQ